MTFKYLRIGIKPKRIIVAIISAFSIAVAFCSFFPYREGVNFQVDTEVNNMRCKELTHNCGDSDKQKPALSSKKKGKQVVKNSKSNNWITLGNIGIGVTVVALVVSVVTKRFRAPAAAAPAAAAPAAAAPAAAAPAAPAAAAPAAAAPAAPAAAERARRIEDAIRKLSQGPSFMASLTGVRGESRPAIWGKLEKEELPAENTKWIEWLKGKKEECLRESTSQIAYDQYRHALFSAYVPRVDSERAWLMVGLNLGRIDWRSSTIGDEEVRDVCGDLFGKEHKKCQEEIGKKRDELGKTIAEE